MSTPAPSLFDTLVDLARDPAARAAFDADPAGYLRQAGLGDVTPEQVHDAAPLVAETVGASLPPDAGGDAGGAIGQIQQLVHIAGPADHVAVTDHGPAFRDDAVDLDFQRRPDIDFQPVQQQPQTVPEKVSADLAGLEREAHAHGYPDGQSYLQAEEFRPIQEVVYDQAPDAAHSYTYLRQVSSLAHDAGYRDSGEFLRDAQHGLDPAVSARLMLVDEAHHAGYPDVQHYLDAWHDGRVDLDDGSVGQHDVLRALARDAGHQHRSLEDLLGGHNHGGPAFTPSPDAGELPFVHHAGPSEPDVDALTREAHAHGFPDAQHYLDAAPFAGEDNVYFRAPDAGQDFSQLKALRAMAHDAGYDDVADFGRASARGLSESDHARVLLAQEARANGYPDGRSYLDAYHRGEIDVRDPNLAHPDDRVDHVDNHDVLRWLAKESTHGHAGIDDYLNSGLHHGQHPVDESEILDAHRVVTQEPIDDWPTRHEPLPIDRLDPIDVVRVPIERVEPQINVVHRRPMEIEHEPIHRVVPQEVWYDHSTGTQAPGLDDPTAAQQGEPGEGTGSPDGPFDAGHGDLTDRPDAAAPTATSENHFGAGHTGSSVTSSGPHTLVQSTADHGSGDQPSNADDGDHGPDLSTVHEPHPYEDRDHGGNTGHSSHESSSGGDDHHTDPSHSMVHGG